MSEQQLTIEEPLKNKIFRKEQILLAALLTGPLVPSYILAHNFKIFGENKKAKITWAILIIITIIPLFSIVLSIITPEIIKITEIIDNIPQKITLLINIGAYYWAMHHYQDKKIKDYINAGGIFESWWKTILIIFIVFVIAYLLFMMVWFYIFLVSK